VFLHALPLFDLILVEGRGHGAGLLPGVSRSTDTDDEAKHTY